MGDGRWRWRWGWRWGTEFDVCLRELHLITLNQGQGGMCICRVLGIGAGVSQECFGPLTPGLGLRLVNPRFHEGRLCRAAARTSTPMTPSGAGRESRPLEICAWGPRPWCIQQRVGHLLAGLVSRRDEVRRRCRTVLQSKAEALLRDSRPDSQHSANAHPTLALV